MARTVAFYRDVLGLEPTFTSPYWTEFSVGPLTFALHGGGATASGGWTLGLSTDDLAALKAAADGHVAEDYHQTPGGVVLTLSDPDGNRVQVIQPGSRLDQLR